MKRGRGDKNCIRKVEGKVMRGEMKGREVIGIQCSVFKIEGICFVLYYGGDEKKFC